MLKKFLIVLALFWMAQCEYKHKIHELDIKAGLEETYLKTRINCGSDLIKNNTGKACYCGTVDYQCCAAAAKCTGDVQKKCDTKATTCDDEVKKGVEYYKKETEEIEKVYCDKISGDGACYCGNIDISCCEKKDKCETKALIMRVCATKAKDEQACQKSVDAQMVKSKLEKPWFYKRVADLNSAYTLMASFGLLAILALF